jgi:hypothetical protein
MIKKAKNTCRICGEKGHFPNSNINNKLGSYTTLENTECLKWTLHFQKSIKEHVAKSASNQTLDLFKTYGVKYSEILFPWIPIDHNVIPIVHSTLLGTVQ